MFDMFFKALGEPTRLKLVRLLAEKEMCICDLEEIMQISQPRISQHLKILKQVGLISERKIGQKRMCSFNQEVFNQTMTEFEEFMHKPLIQIEGYHEEALRLETADGKAFARKGKF